MRFAFSRLPSGAYAPMASGSERPEAAFQILIYHIPTSALSIPNSQNYFLFSKLRSEVFFSRIPHSDFRIILYALCPFYPQLVTRIPQPATPLLHLPQFLYQLFHILRYRRLKSHELTRMGMGQAQSPGVQHLSGYCFEPGSYR